MMNRLKHSADFFDPPRTVTVDGKNYPIRWDFSAALRFMEYVDRSEDDDETFLRTVLEIWYPQVPENTDEALTQAIGFYCGGDDPREGYYTPAFAPTEERQGIYLGFLTQFGIDLNREQIHWWVFRRLLQHLKKGGRTREYGNHRKRT